MKTFFECIIGIGLFITVGSAGSSDINAIDLTQSIIYALVGLAITFIGMTCHKGIKKWR